jgi:hypothetical protein
MDMTHDADDAEAIAGEGKYETIVEKLRESGELSSCVEKTKNTYGNRLRLDNFIMDEQDWEMLSVLGLYDMDTLEHSIRTFELAYHIVTHPFQESSGETVVFADFLSQPGASVSLTQFLRAALFHDIGKIVVPREILHNALDDEEVLVRMLPEGTLTDKEEGKKAILQMLYANGIRPIDITPIKEIFPEEKYTELLCSLEKRGFSEKSTLKDVIRTHEPESKRILTSLGYQTEGELAGRHHNYEKEEHRHTVNVSGHLVGIADLIRIADVTDALRNARWYKKPLAELDVLFILTQDALAGKIDSHLAHLWVKDQYAELQKKDGLVIDGDEKQEEVRAIEMFIDGSS